jgi:hypothetical protein
MQNEQKTTRLLTVEVDPMKCARARVGKNTPTMVGEGLPIGAVPVDGGECGRWRRTWKQSSRRRARKQTRRGWKSRRGGEQSRRGWKSRRRFPESWRGWGFAVMETEPGAKELITGARQYLYGN